VIFGSNNKMEAREENFVSQIYDGYNETQKEIFAIEIRKTKFKLLTIAVVIFMFDFLALSMANVLFPRNILLICILPAIMILLWLFSAKEPLVAMVIASVLILAVWVYSFIILGARAAFTGWLPKIVLVCLVFAGFQNAITAHKIKRELKL
jgi:hypothetical protein